MRNKNRPIYMILPVLVIYLLQNGISIFTTQIAMMYIVATKGPFTFEEYLNVMMDYLASSEYLFFMSFICEAAGVILFVIWYFNIIKKERIQAGSKEEVKFVKPIVPLVILGIVFVTLGFEVFGSYITELISLISPKWILQYIRLMDTIGFDVTQGSRDVVYFIYVVLLAPLMEEYAFRGVCLRYGMKSLPKMAACVVSALLFAILHGNPLQSIYTFIFALILGYVYVNTEKIWITIAIHIGFNGVSFLYPQIGELPQSPIIGFLALFLSITAIYVGLNIIIKNYRDYGGKELKES